MQQIQTERLFLRPWAIEDLPLAQKLWGAPEVMAFIDVRGGLTPQQVELKLKAEIDCFEKHQIQYAPIFEKGSGDFVGCCGLKPWVHSELGTHEMGFHLIKDKWGKGYALEIATEVAKYAFRELSLTHIMAGHHPENVNSKKILEKIGFQFVEKVFFAPTGLMHSSYRLDLCRC